MPRLAAALTLGLLLSSASLAAADPIVDAPPLGRVTWGDPARDLYHGGLIGDLRLIGALAGTRLSFWPDRELAITRDTPIPAAARLGLVVHTSFQPWTYVIQLDLAELLRSATDDVSPSDDALPFSSALIDDLYVRWRPSAAAQLILGRQRVPFSKWRHYDERDLVFGAVPFAVDRLAPDRRYGLTFAGDLGALAWAGGVYEDLDALEPRQTHDLSQNGRLAAAAHAEWTPIAPMMGSNPVGQIVGAQGTLPTPRKDPWYSTHRVSLGLGAFVRLDEQNAATTALSLSLQWKWRFISLLGEGLLSSQAGAQTTAAHAELAFTPIDRVSLHLRGELDDGAHPGSARTAGASVMWHATDDRRSRIGVTAWTRRADRDAGPARAEDAALVVIATSL